MYTVKWHITAQNDSSLSLTILIQVITNTCQFYPKINTGIPCFIALYFTSRCFIFITIDPPTVKRLQFSEGSDGG